MDLSFLDNLFRPIGKGLSEADTFMKREMPFDSGWGAPAAAVAAYFGGPMALEAMGGLGEASAAGAGEAGGAGFMDSFGSMFGGGETGGFGIGQGSNYADFSNTSGGSFGNLNPMQSLQGGEYGLNYASPSGIASSNSAMGLSDLSAPSSMSSFGQSLAKQLLKQKQGGQSSQTGYQYQEQPVQRQAAFALTPPTFQVQNKESDIAALIAALRNKGNI
jgi:hypothetical protein